MGCDLERYEKSGYRGEENIKNDRRTSGRARNRRIRTNQELREILNLES